MIKGILPHAAAQPIAFSGTIGLYTPAGTAEKPARLAVLFASPWGLEEMSVRRFWRVTAEKLAEHGIPSLRFDYPGTGDALDMPSDELSLATWVESIVTASERLKALSGCGRIAVVGEGLGALLAIKAADALEGVEAMALIAPVISGRMHLRELALWSSVVDDNLGLSAEQRDRAPGTIASLSMPQGVVEDLRSVNLTALDTVPASRVLVASRPERPADAEFSAHLRSLGGDVTDIAFNGYQALVANPTLSTLPMALVDDLTQWICALPVAPHDGPEKQAPVAGELRGADFVETPVRFGVSDNLVGILCQPASDQYRSRHATAVVFVSSAYDRHAGWGRSTVAMARRLAGLGIASLRFDTAGVADSPPVTGRPAQVLYDDSQIGDVTDALDLLQSHGFARIIVSGRCSGAYLAFRSALKDQRISGVVAVNPAVFRWQPGRSVEDAIANGSRSLQDYGRRAFNVETFRRLRAGQVDVGAALSNIAGGLGRRVLHAGMRALRFSLPEGREIKKSFERLHRRGAKVSLIYSDHDLGLEQYVYYFGRNGRGHAHWKGVKATIIPDADHNLTPPAARQVYLEAVKAMALSVAPPVVVVSERTQVAAAE